MKRISNKITNELLYNKKYFTYQKEIGKFGAKANLFKFKGYIKKRYSILDFGCGGGFLLELIDAKEKIGIEINPVARKLAQKNGLKVYKNYKSIKEDSLDLVISNHALEHTFNPLQELINLKRLLKRGGKIIFVVPHDNGSFWNKKDPNQHLFTWDPTSLANLFNVAGFRVLKSEKLMHRWPPLYQYIYQFLGEENFHKIAKIYSYIDRRSGQVILVAKK